MGRTVRRIIFHRFHRPSADTCQRNHGDIRVRPRGQLARLDACFYDESPQRSRCVRSVPLVDDVRRRVSRRNRRRQSRRGTTDRRCLEHLDDLVVQRRRHIPFPVSVRRRCGFPLADNRDDVDVAEGGRRRRAGKTEAASAGGGGGHKRRQPVQRRLTSRHCGRVVGRRRVSNYCLQLLAQLAHLCVCLCINQRGSKHNRRT